MKYFGVGLGFLFLGAATATPAQTLWHFDQAEFQRYAGPEMPIPGGTGNFARFSDVVLDGNNVAFIGYDSSNRQGIYTVTASRLLRVADTHTPIPGGTGNFTVFGLDAGNGIGLAYRGGQLAFHAYGPNGQRGIYTVTSDGLAVVADTNTVVPGTANNFRVFSAPVVDAGYVVFSGGYTNEGIWASSGGTLRKVAGVENLGTSYQTFDLASLDGNVVAFVAKNQYGSPDIFKLNLADGTFTNPLGRGSQVPGQDSFIWDVNTLVMRDGVIAFAGLALPNDSTNGVAGSGVFTDDGSSGLRAIDYDTRRDRLSNFAAYNGLSVSAGTVAYHKIFNNIDQGIFADQAGVLSQVVKPGDTPAGQAVQNAYSYAGSLDGNRLLFVGFNYPTYTVFLAYDPAAGAICPPIVLTGSPLPDATVGLSYQRSLGATGGAWPYTFSLSGGTLPDGLALGTNGVISGTPTAAGTFSFTAQATDSNSCSSVGDFQIVSVPDQDPPVLALYDLRAEGTSSAGAVVAYAVSATDNVDPQPVVSCSPAAGSTFPLGTTTVNCTATDNSGNAASGSFTVTVSDTTPPALQLPAPITVHALVPEDGTISFSVSATDAVDPAPAVSCSPASGSLFPLGVTTVSCSTTDASSNTSAGSFTVEVIDSAAPVLTVPASFGIEASSHSGAPVTYDASATDSFDSAPVVSCTPASGSVFPPGTTTVQCTATDASGNAASASFDVQVSEVTPPALADGGGGGALPGSTLLLLSLMAARRRARGRASGPLARR